MLACSAMGAGAAAVRVVPPQPVKSPEQFRKIAALAVVFCLSVVLGNVALRFIPVSFSQVGLVFSILILMGHSNLLPPEGRLRCICQHGWPDMKLYRYGGSTLSWQLCWDAAAPNEQRLGT